jgi:predicted transposase/invertase (TIGR01784 family)
VANLYAGRAGLKGLIFQRAHCLAGDSNRPGAARDPALFSRLLPAELVDLLDLSDLEISKDSFIDPELQEHFSDLFYKVGLHAGAASYVYVLFEHKSYPEPLIAFQLLRYMVRIWEQSLKQEQLQLLPILPIVVYHGRTRWTVAVDFVALFDVPEAMRAYIPNYQYWLADLSRYSDEEIKGEVILRAGLLLLKYIMRDELRARLGDIVSLLTELPKQESGLAYLETMLRYVMGSTDKISVEDLTQVVRQVLEEGESVMPTIAEQLLEQGRVEGLKEGLEKGRQEGQREEAINLLRRFLNRRFGAAVDNYDEALRSLDLTAVRQLSDIAFEVETLAEFETKLAELVATASAQSDQNNGAPSLDGAPSRDGG